MCCVSLLSFSYTQHPALFQVPISDKDIKLHRCGYVGMRSFTPPLSARWVDFAEMLWKRSLSISVRAHELCFPQTLPKVWLIVLICPRAPVRETRITDTLCSSEADLHNVNSHQFCFASREMSFWSGRGAFHRGVFSGLHIERDLGHVLICIVFILPIKGKGRSQACGYMWSSVL